MDAKDLQNLIQVIQATQVQGWTVAEMCGVVTAVVVCLVTTYGFIRSVINTGFETLKIQNGIQNITLEKQEAVLKEINSTLTTVRTDYVTHDVCSKRQQQLCSGLGLKDIKDRVLRLETKMDEKK